MAKMLFSKNEELITITVYYRVKTNKFGVRQYKILEEEEAKTAISNGDKDVDILTSKWAVPTWKSNSHLIRSSTFYNPSDGQNKVDWSRYQDNIFKNCLKEWDVFDENNTIVPINADTIGSLPVVVASALLDKYEKSLSLEEEDRKKL